MEIAANPGPTLGRLPAGLVTAPTFGLGIGLPLTGLEDLADTLLFGHPAQHLDDLRMERNSAILLIALGISHNRPSRIEPAIPPIEVQRLAGPCAFEHREQ